ncbi:MAG: Asp23/Gls24 family envelope stress response protein [Clostridiaceae bacterium]|nr:Asp23/Gls24 family envelope stress response protein [Clostridiaceae bacterium]
MKLENEKGTIAVSNRVIAAVAGNAASACFGVKGMTETSVKDGIVRLLKREQMTKGVFVTPSEDGMSVDIELHIAVDPGVNIAAVGGPIIAEVRYNVERQTGFKTGNISVCVDGIKA